MKFLRRFHVGGILLPLLLASLAPGAFAEGDDERNNNTNQRDLEQKVEILTEEVSRLREQMNIPETDRELEGAYGLGPAASKVYGISQGISFGGYGEFYFASPYGDTETTGKVNTTDFYRFITYVGYKFNDWIVMNGEIEYEHATTSGNYQGKSGSVSVEFAYLDFLFHPAINVRGGNLLVPMGIVNLIHEPPTYWGNFRPFVETSIIPGTWREMGIGAHGNVGGVSYSAYVLNGFNGSKFDANGVRGGRQKGNRAIWEDVGGVVALEYSHGNSLRVGGSAYGGGADQGLVTSESGSTIGVTNRIVEGHVDFRYGGLRTRALVAAGHITNAAALSRALYLDSGELTQQVPVDQLGWYVEAGYDVARLLDRNAGYTLTPWVRYEDYDLQYNVSDETGLPANPALDGSIVTVGLETKPHPNVVVKLDWVFPADESDAPTSNEVRLGAGFIY